ncbi:hypothetical protein LAZ67_X003802 [Cordylochernes scorpioides]|uniref:Uncharacterized protein n=1 Tax=Cordylochernes scorpioides TaxID=51811 RepID=A0ABY6LXP8_9ARAC|nr:hypothetical protein LAZ67_X003802 [Cordylochernes scorpioides]
MIVVCRAEIAVCRGEDRRLQRSPSGELRSPSTDMRSLPANKPISNVLKIRGHLQTFVRVLKRSCHWIERGWVVKSTNGATSVSSDAATRRCWQEWVNNGRMQSLYGNVRPRNTTEREDSDSGRISIEDDPLQGRPKFERTDENVQRITDLIKENPRTTLLLEKDIGIYKTTIGRIVTEDLKLKKTLAKFIPRFLSNEQKLCRLATCENMLEMTRTDPEWKDKIITGDETWVYGYDPETKRQSAEWRGQGEPRPKNPGY